MSDTYKFIHVRVHEDSRVFGAITIAYTKIVGEVYPEQEGFWVGVAYCSPKEQFTKAIGRAISAGRAHKQDFAVFVPKDTKGITAAIEKRVLTYLMTEPTETPRWFKNFPVKFILEQQRKHTSTFSV